jgi:hypothetical protein
MPVSTTATHEAVQLELPLDKPKSSVSGPEATTQSTPTQVPEARGVQGSKSVEGLEQKATMTGGKSFLGKIGGVASGVLSGIFAYSSFKRRDYMQGTVQGTISLLSILEIFGSRLAAKAAPGVNVASTVLSSAELVKQSFEEAASKPLADWNKGYSPARETIREMMLHSNPNMVQFNPSYGQ